MDRGILLIVIVWLVYLGFLLPLYLIKEKQCGAIKAIRYKLALSGVFCMIGFFNILLQNFNVVSILIFIGFVSALIGDYFLAFIDIDVRKFIYGIAFFGVTQISYISAMAVFVGFGFLEFIILLIIIIPLILSRRRMKLDTGKSTWPLTIYSVLVTFMAVKAIVMLFSENPPLALQVLFSAGAFLFLMSDILLCVNKFRFPKRILSYLVGIFYFSGQIMIATAMFFQ